MIPEREIWQAAKMIKRYVDDAVSEAEFRADHHTGRRRRGWLRNLAAQVEDWVLRVA